MLAHGEDEFTPARTPVPVQNPRSDHRRNKESSHENSIRQQLEDLQSKAPAKGGP
jgi:hypothetical protein